MAGTYRYQHGEKPVEGYTILRGIGRGGFGEVYYAVSDGGREVALKAIQQNHDIELRGVRHCINLKSPHLVSIFDVKKNADGIPFVIMEFVAGPSLRDIASREERGLGPEKACYLVREIAKGLTYLHDRGIVHRDLKPENIFYEDGYAKIGDYGLSKYISVSRQSGQTISVGTVHYMAPEIGSGNYHQGIDIYALGIILFELLTGNVPFNGDSMGEILMKHLTQEPDVSMLETHFQPIVRKALAKNPIDRYQSAREMIDAIFANEALSAAVARLDSPTFLSTVPPLDPAGTLETSLLRGADTTPVPPPRQERPQAVPPPPPVTALPPEPLTDTRRWPTWRAFEDRLVPGVATTGACAMGLSFFSGRINFESIIVNALMLGVVSAAILAVEHWFAPRFRLTSGFVRRCATFGIVGPALLTASRFSMGLGVPIASPTGAMIGLLIGLFAVDWNARARSDRQEQVSTLLAISAGLFGLVAGAIAAEGRAGGGSLFSAFGFLASLSLIVNAASPFTPFSERRKVRAQTPRDRLVSPTAGGPEPTPPKPPRDRNAWRSVETAGPLPPPLPVSSTAGSSQSSMGARALVRPRRGRVIAGVCAGIARRFDWDPALTRIVAVLLLLSGFGSPSLVYVLCWIFIPGEAKSALAVIPETNRAPRRRGTLRRAFWALLAAGFFVGGLVMLANERNLDFPVVAVWLLLNVLATGSAYLSVQSRPNSEMAGPRLASMSLMVGGSLLLILSGFLGTAVGAMESGIAARALPHVEGFHLSPTRADSLSYGALCTFGLAVLCFVGGRLHRGFGHALRGLVGWAGLGVSFSGLLVEGTETVRHWNGIMSAATFPTELIPLLGFGVLGVASLVVLGWPERPARAQADLVAQPAGGPLA